MFGPYFELAALQYTGPPLLAVLTPTSPPSLRSTARGGEELSRVPTAALAARGGRR